MFDTYTDALEGKTANALLARRPGGMYIATLSTPREIRNRGCARRILSAICADADKNQLDLWLDLAPMDGLTDYTRLEQFYRDFGFVELRSEWHRRFRKL